MIDNATHVGLAYVDSSGRRMGVCEFVDSEHLCELEAAIMQLGARECVIAKVGAGAGWVGGAGSCVGSRPPSCSWG